MEHRQLKERREGKLREALGPLLPGESVEVLDAIGEQVRLRAERGLVAVVGRGGISFVHLTISPASTCAPGPPQSGCR
jgi:hypothetical protein